MYQEKNPNKKPLSSGETLFSLYNTIFKFLETTAEDINLSGEIKNVLRHISSDDEKFSEMHNLKSFIVDNSLALRPITAAGIADSMVEGYADIALHIPDDYLRPMRDDLRDIARYVSEENCYRIGKIFN